MTWWTSSLGLWYRLNRENSVFGGYWWRIFPASRMSMPFALSFRGRSDRIREVEALTGQVLGEVDHLANLATHFVTNDDHMEMAIAVQAELEEQLKVFEKEGKDCWKPNV